MAQPVEITNSALGSLSDKENDSCPICRAASPKYLCNTHNGHSSTKSLRHCRCRSCGLVFVGNHFDDDELGEAYGGLNSTEYYNEIRTENLRKMDQATSNLKEFLELEDRIIDIGTGDGSFIRVLHQAGFKNLSCHEIPGSDLSAIEEISESIYLDYDFKTIPSETFKAVTMLDVIEHVRDPRSLLENCFRILKPGGVVYFHTPVVTRTDRLMHFLMKAPFLRAIGRTWQSGRTSIFHLRNYTPRSLKALLNQTKFELAEIAIKNELSWPVSMYVRVYLVDKFRLPGFLTAVFTPLMYPLLATDLLNANKSIVTARRPGLESPK